MHRSVKATFLSFNQMVETITTKAQKLLESFKTEKPLNKILLRFSEKQSVDLSK